MRLVKGKPSGWLLTAPVVMLLLAACGAAAVPAEALAGVEARAARTLRTEDLSPWLDATRAPVSLTVLDARLRDGHTERRAYLADRRGNTRYLGALQPQLPDAPVEALFFSLDGSRFAILWVDETVAGKVDTVTLGRPIQRPYDDSMNVLRAGGAANRVAIVPIAPDEAELWNELSDLLIYSGGLDFAWQHSYAPPLPIGPRFQTITLP